MGRQGGPGLGVSDASATGEASVVGGEKELLDWGGVWKREENWVTEVL